jgi:hypothetical protein
MSSTGPVNFDVFLGEYITVRKPMPTTVPRGPHSGRYQAPTITLRIHSNEKDLVTSAAALMGMSRSQYLVWCGARVAEQILRKKAEYDKLYASPKST